jgi:hypothetical protein
MVHTRFLYLRLAGALPMTSAAGGTTNTFHSLAILPDSLDGNRPRS